MKMKTSLLVGAFSFGLLFAGCTGSQTPGPAGPQGQPGVAAPAPDPGQDADRRRAEDQKRADDQRHADDQNRADNQKRADDQRHADDKAREAGEAKCPAGEHIYTNPDGKKSCVRD